MTRFFLLVVFILSQKFASAGELDRLLNFGRRDSGLEKVTKLAVVAYGVSQIVKGDRHMPVQPKTYFFEGPEVQIGDVWSGDREDLRTALFSRGARVMEPLTSKRGEIIAPYVIDLSTSFERGRTKDIGLWMSGASASWDESSQLGRAQITLYKIEGNTKVVVASADVWADDRGECYSARLGRWSRVSIDTKKPSSRARAIKAAIEAACDGVAEQVNRGGLARYSTDTGRPLLPYACPACGAKCQQAWNFCGVCGAKLP